MQIVKEDKLRHIEKVLATSPEISVVKTKYGSDLTDTLRDKKSDVYGELVRITVAPKNDAANMQQLIKLRDGLMQKIGLAPSWRPEIMFTGIGKRWGLTSAEIVYSEVMPKRRIVESGRELSGERDIWIAIYPNQAMATALALPPAFNGRQLIQITLDLTERDMKNLEIASNAFKITHRERLQYAFEKMQRKQLNQE